MDRLDSIIEIIQSANHIELKREKAEPLVCIPN
jgi:hypothetical protein